LIYNGRKSPETSTSINQVRSEISSLKKNKDDLVFLHVARFNWQKNQLLLIDVFNKLLEEGNHLILLILGMNFDSREAKSLRESSKSGIYFLNEKSNVTDYYMNSDAFCLSSIVEGLPITLLEALACGCIPICTAVGGIKDVIKDEIYGYLDHDITVKSYYETVKRFISQKNKIPKSRLIKYFNENFSIEKCAEEHYAIYSK
jgi:glycosyltransferase involved in cell wall biosynthesis